ncbi:hypothetical protein [Pseudoxanthomonas beigongshangi]|uniref:hypothetical protein n=1 Tax=Pseudoxanthomonas beigongshangi TaxID=2782537 RepID=UPI00193C3F5A|nr:hypothetical protein [Pseudoxanthomonas beigongshangi]
MITITDVTGKDRLYFSQQRALITAVHHAWACTTTYSVELRQRLDHLDELHESVDLEQAGCNVQHRFSGEPVPWMQQQFGPAVGAVAAATERLQFAAVDLESAANDAGNMHRLAHIARGHLALVAEAQRVVESFRPGRERAQVDWTRVDAVVTGIRRLEDLADAELRDELRHELRAYDERPADLRAAGHGDMADVMATDPVLQRALRTMREYRA